MAVTIKDCVTARVRSWPSLCVINTTNYVLTKTGIVVASYWRKKRKKQAVLPYIELVKKWQALSNKLKLNCAFDKIFVSRKETGNEHTSTGFARVSSAIGVFAFNLCFFFVYKTNNIKCINVDPDHFKNNQIQFHTGHITHFEKITFRKNNCDRARALLTTFVWRGGGWGMDEDAHAHARWSSTDAWVRSMW